MNAFLIVVASLAALACLSLWAARILSRRFRRSLSACASVFECEDCGRTVNRVSSFIPQERWSRCLDCENFPGWFLDPHLSRAFDPANQARPRPDYVKGSFK